jgi:hypothetical protein
MHGVEERPHRQRPANLAECASLQSVDPLYNSLTGLIPKELFVLWNLTKLLLLSNKLLGIVPPDIGNCTNNQPLLTPAQ